MSTFLWVVATNLTAVILASGFRFALARTYRTRIAALFTLGVPILLLPLAIPRELRNERFLAAVWSLVTIAKLFDCHVGIAHSRGATFRAYLGFLINPFSFVFRRLSYEAAPSRRLNMLRLARGVAIYLLVIGFFALVDFHQLVSGSFVLEHAAATLLMMISIFAGAEAATALWRLPGLKAHDPFRNFFLAPTPAEFWRRYNRLAGQIFTEDVFRPMKRKLRNRRHSTAFATLLVFVLSGAVHEYVFAMAIGRVQGFQMSFFLIQGIAVMLTIRIKPHGWGAVVWWSATVLFNLAVSVIFYASWHQVGAIYSDAAPSWMGG